MMEYRYFTLDEFDSPDQPGSGQKMDRNFVAMLDEARDIAGMPFKINSGYRTEARNKAVKGSSGSSHLVGKAADIACTDSLKRFRIIAALIAAGFTRIGIGSTFIHVDNDSLKTPGVAWLYG
jgi:uncharacterized protein YcbK (DUF882 family)